MRRRFLGNHIALALIGATAACTTPQHSNALIFGTNTSVGLNVGPNATGSPSIQVGYNRQEAVFMPLVANVHYDANGVPTPCDVYPGRNYQVTGPSVVNGQSVPQVPPCFLVGQNGGSLDSYSVLASFGAQFSANGTTPSASGGLAQFFATGIAAQLLAIRGGSALVATGTAAEVASASDTDNAVAALYHAPEVERVATIGLARVPVVQAALSDYVTNHTTDQNLQEKLGGLETAAGVPPRTLTSICATANRANCVLRLNSAIGAATLGMYSETDWEGAIAHQVQAGG